MTNKTPPPTKPRPSAPTPPEAAPAVPKPGPERKAERPRLDPVRYGDWEKNGRCIDF